ncbi:unnamed protein product [Mytilus coruscus]|uniref:CCHC-type domain-containing protein n=1 Tax=Mytilus coruscus TaxID=42192 RepID=A0A6J8D9S1_MYTCO|nr:unnamed protein product [Mytilus coruscus]
MIGHPTSMFQPPRGGPPQQAPTILTPYNQQYIPGLTYPSLGQPNLSGYQPQPLHVPYQQLPIPDTQQQPPTSGAPQPHYNQPSARPKEYNSDYYMRQHVSTYRQTRNKRRSGPEYNRPREDQQRDFSPIRSVRSSPLHRTRNSPRRSRGSNDSQSESDTDGRLSKGSRGSRKKKDKLEKRPFLSSIPKTLRYSGKAHQKAVSAIQKPGKPANESSSEKQGNSPVVLGVGSTKSSMDNRLSRIEEHIEKMMSTVTSLVQDKSAKQGTSPSSRSPNQDNRSSNYSPRQDKTEGAMITNECYYCHKQGHYKRNCPDLWRINNRQQPKQLTPKNNTKDERRVEFEEDNFVQDEVDKTSTGGASVGTLGSAHLFRCVVKIQNKEVNALIDTGSEVTILKDSVFDALTQKPYIIRETTMHGAGRDMRMTSLRIDLESAGMASDYLIEPKGNTTLLVPRTVCAKGQKPTLCFLNITDNPVRIPKGDEVGYTQEVKVIQSMDEESLTSVAHIIISDDNSCLVAAITQSEGISFTGFTTEEIKIKQSEDPDLLLLLNLLKDKVEPTQNTLFSASPAVKSYWINKEKFFLDDSGILKSYPKDEGASVRMSYKGDKEMKKEEEDPKLGGRLDYNNNASLQTGTLQPRLGRGTTMEGIGGTYELVSGVGFVLVEEASASSTLQVHGEKATLPPHEQAVLPLVEDILAEEVGDSAPVADPEGMYDYRCPRSGRMERTFILSQRDPVRGCSVVTRGVKRHVLGEHLSYMFAPTQEPHLMRDPGFHRYRGHMAMVLAQWLTGQTSATFDDLVRFLRRHARVSVGYPQAGEEMSVFRTVCREMGWRTQAWFRIQPVFLATTVIDNLVPAGAESGSCASLPERSVVLDTPVVVEQPCAAAAMVTTEEAALVEEEEPEERFIVILQHQDDRRMVPAYSLRNLRVLAEDRFQGDGRATLFFQGMIIDPLLTLMDIVQMEPPRPTIEVRFLDSTNL